MQVFIYDSFAVLCECSVAQSVSECRLHERTQPPVANCQNSWRHGNEDNVGKSSNDQKKLSRRAAVVVEIVDRDNAGSPGCNEKHDESENHLEEQTMHKIGKVKLKDIET